MLLLSDETRSWPRILAGATLMITSLAVLMLIVRQPDKPRADWMVTAFFGCIAMSVANTVLANGLVFWRALFAPWQDFRVIAAGVTLTRYAFASPEEPHRREGRIVLDLRASWRSLPWSPA